MLVWSLFYTSQQKSRHQCVGFYKSYKISWIGHWSAPININMLIVCLFGHDFLVVVAYSLHYSRGIALLTTNSCIQSRSSGVSILSCPTPLYVLRAKVKNFICGISFSHTCFKSCASSNRALQCLQVHFHEIHPTDMYGPINI